MVKQRKFFKDKFSSSQRPKAENMQVFRILMFTQSHFMSRKINLQLLRWHKLLILTTPCLQNKPPSSAGHAYNMLNILYILSMQTRLFKCLFKESMILIISEEVSRWLVKSHKLFKTTKVVESHNHPYSKETQHTKEN